MKFKSFRVSAALIGVALALAVVLIPAFVVVVLGAPSAQAQTFGVLYSFKGKHGKNPAGLIQDKRGNLYGTTYNGGAYNRGTVFELKADGKEKVVYSFTGGADGGYPAADLVRDSAGNLYGTTVYGGYSSCKKPGNHGCGVVFKVDASGAETVLHSFTGGADGRWPTAGLVRDSAGNLYGTTEYGGGYSPCESYGCGVVFKVDAIGAETVLHAFTGGADGGYPVAGLVRDSAGNLYGTTCRGGDSDRGTVFKVDKSGNETVLHSFTAGADGDFPVAGLVRDSAGNLYGTAEVGGPYNSGVVFKLKKTGAETVLYNFPALADGLQPASSLVRDSDGNLYGTTLLGGPDDAGVVFKLDTTGTETVLYSFTGGTDGGYPAVGVVRDSAGNLYGTAGRGAYYDGVVFKITPQ